MAGVLSTQRCSVNRAQEDRFVICVSYSFTFGVRGELGGLATCGGGGGRPYGLWSLLIPYILPFYRQEFLPALIDIPEARTLVAQNKCYGESLYQMYFVPQDDVRRVEAFSSQRYGRDT